MKTIINKSYSCIGVDGCKGRWVVVCISDNGFEVGKFKTIYDICSRYPEADSYIIDIPIGLVEDKNQTRPDLLVKKELGKKGSSIFGVPCRQAIYAADKKEAKDLNIAILGKSLSEQTLGITKSIKQVDEFLYSNPSWKNRLLESHPELCFSKLNRNRPILEDKKKPDGQRKRLEILTECFPEANNVIEKYLTDVPYRKKIDDVIDALCLAVTGKLILENGLKTIPEKPRIDSRGLLIQMVYADCSKYNYF